MRIPLREKSWVIQLAFRGGNVPAKASRCKIVIEAVLTLVNFVVIRGLGIPLLAAAAILWAGIIGAAIYFAVTSVPSMIWWVQESYTEQPVTTVGGLALVIAVTFVLTHTATRKRIKERAAKLWKVICPEYDIVS